MNKKKLLHNGKYQLSQLIVKEWEFISFVHITDWSCYSIVIFIAAQVTLLLARLLTPQIIFPILCVVSDKSFVLALLRRAVGAVCVCFNEARVNLSSNLDLFCESGAFWVTLSTSHLRVCRTPLYSAYLYLLVHVYVCVCVFTDIESFSGWLLCLLPFNIPHAEKHCFSSIFSLMFVGCAPFRTKLRMPFYF